MALPAGRYGVTKNQLLKIKKLPMNTIKLIEELTEKFDLLGSAAFKNSTSVVTDSTDLVESGAVYTALQGKCDNSVIAPVENQPTCQKSGGYAVSEHFQRGGKFCTVTATIAYGEAFTLNTNYVEGTIADYLGYTLTNAVALTAKLTLDSTFKKVAKRGFAIEFQVRFDVTENIVGDTDIINLGYTNFDNLFMYYPIFNRNSPYSPITTNGCYLKANGYLHIAGTLPVGGYVISGCFLTNK